MSANLLLPEELDKLPEVLRDFAAMKVAIDGLSERTVCEYLIDLRTFLRFTEARRLHIQYDSEKFKEIDITCIDDDYLRKITPIVINEFLLYAKQGRDNEWAARSRKLSSLKTFFKYLKLQRRTIQTNPTEDLTSTKKRTTLPKHLTLEESIKLLQTVKNDTFSKTVARDFCIVTLFLNCGMRLSELVGIDLDKIDPDFNSLVVTGKGGKERMIYLNNSCRRAMYDYLVFRQDKKPEQIGTNAFFLSSRDRRISNKTVQWMVYKYLALAGLDYKKLSVHKLRHTAATLMYQSGKVDVRVLKDILGHAQLNTTQIYTHISDENMLHAMNENPLSDIAIKKNKNK